METVWLVVSYKTGVIQSYMDKYTIFDEKKHALEHAVACGFRLQGRILKEEIGYMNVYKHRHVSVGIMHLEIKGEEPKYLRKKVKRKKRSERR